MYRVTLPYSVAVNAPCIDMHFLRQGFIPRSSYVQSPCIMRSTTKSAQRPVVIPLSKIAQVQHPGMTFGKGEAILAVLGLKW